MTWPDGDIRLARGDLLVWSGRFTEDVLVEYTGISYARKPNESAFVGVPNVGGVTVLRIGCHYDAKLVICEVRKRSGQLESVYMGQLRPPTADDLLLLERV